VYVAAYADKAGLTDRQVASLVTGGPDDECWDDADRVLIRLCDARARIERHPAKTRSPDTPRSVGPRS
jgi:hypothetical protein